MPCATPSLIGRVQRRPVVFYLYCFFLLALLRVPLDERAYVGTKLPQLIPGDVVALIDRPPLQHAVNFVILSRVAAHRDARLP